MHPRRAGSGGPGTRRGGAGSGLRSRRCAVGSALAVAAGCKQKDTRLKPAHEWHCHTCLVSKSSQDWLTHANVECQWKQQGNKQHKAHGLLAVHPTTSLHLSLPPTSFWTFSPELDGPRCHLLSLDVPSPEAPSSESMEIMLAPLQARRTLAGPGLVTGQCS